ncbi:MAG: Leucine dehydrogenase [Chlamydiales bacterium]|nr:Leucine dehydrogenase [Chlamydiales bacterium]MCH9619888.1 Leucine dehydrogenase [Chlamydiales bacterium]MCH9622685.1 Leucine dehydrogenase [Chlamydiales bacterium]
MGHSSIVFNELSIEGYERVVEVTEEKSNLHALIAIHDTRLGPALGGIRAYCYDTFEQGLNDVLRLSRGMSYKSAATQVGTGGGKSVILLKPGQSKTRELLHAFGEAVELLEGSYICAEDLGVTQEDLTAIGEKTRYIVGTPQTSGNPSCFTAWGVFRGIEAVCQYLWGTPSVEDRVIAIQGLGAAGWLLSHHLFWNGARLIVTDIDKEQCRLAEQAFGAKVVSPEEILSTECDILAPCALGAVINEKSIPTLKCKAIAGIANNQLLKPEDGEALLERGIAYAPDYVLNSGGLINVSIEFEEGGYDAISARKNVDRIYSLILTIFETAEEKKESTYRIAEQIARDNLEKGIGRRTKPPQFTFHQ